MKGPTALRLDVVKLKRDGSFAWRKGKPVRMISYIVDDNIIHSEMLRVKKEYEQETGYEGELYRAIRVDANGKRVKETKQE